MKERLRKRLTGAVAAVLAMAVWAGPVCAQQAEPFDAQGYRSARFRAPVDRDPAPALPITTAQARALHPGRDALFLDVLPAAGARRDSRTGAWTLAEPHETIAGALWFPETGFSPPEPVLWRALDAAVARFARHHPGRPVVVFCRADCWMSWNVARRLARTLASGRAGREGAAPPVRWFDEGIEGWVEAGGTLVAASPVPVPDTP